MRIYLDIGNVRAKGSSSLNELAGKEGDYNKIPICLCKQGLQGRPYESLTCAEFLTICRNYYNAHIEKILSEMD